VASLVPTGLRAIPVTVSLPRGTVVPGDHVDVLATFTTGALHAEVVATEVEVLLVVERPGFDETAESATMLLLVTSETAERIAYARALAELSVAIAPPASVGLP
jgi:Flp pilus assembly protein CpaB